MKTSSKGDITAELMILKNTGRCCFLESNDKAIEVLIFRRKYELSVFRRFALSARFYTEFKKLYEKLKPSIGDFLNGAGSMKAYSSRHSQPLRPHMFTG